MQLATHHFEELAREHRALMRDYGQVQTRCSEQLRAQARDIERLDAQAMRLRAEVIRRETALAWADEDRAALQQAIPGLPARITLARRVETLLASIEALMRERSRGERPPVAEADEAGAGADDETPARRDDPDALEDSLRAADLVICQTGCLSHGAYWRVQGHCRRTGKACVLVEQPEALRIVRIRRASDGQGGARIATLQAPPAP